MQFVTERYTTISIYNHLSHLLRFFSPPSYFFFFLCMVLLHLVTDWYKIFPIKTICRSCYAFFSSLPEFFSRYAVLLHLVTDWYKLFPIKTICRSCYAFFFFPSWFFFQDMQSCCSLSQKDTPQSLYKTICRSCYVFFSPPYFFFLSMYGLVAPCYRLIQIIPYKNHLSLLLHFFFFPSWFFSRYAVLLQFVTDWYKIFSIKTICRSCYVFFSPFLIFFSRYTHVLSCCSLSQKDTPQSLYITICRTCYVFFLHLLFFFFFLCTLLQTDTNYSL